MVPLNCFISRRELRKAGNGNNNKMSFLSTNSAAQDGDACSLPFNRQKWKHMEVKSLVKHLTVFSGGARFEPPFFSSGFKTFILATIHCLGLVGDERKHSSHIARVWHIDGPPKRAVYSSSYQELPVIGSEWPLEPFCLPPPGTGGTHCTSRRTFPCQLGKAELSRTTTNLVPRQA